MKLKIIQRYGKEIVIDIDDKYSKAVDVFVKTNRCIGICCTECPFDDKTGICYSLDYDRIKSYNRIKSIEIMDDDFGEKNIEEIDVEVDLIMAYMWIIYTEHEGDAYCFFCGKETLTVDGDCIVCGLSKTNEAMGLR